MKYSGNFIPQSHCAQLQAEEPHVATLQDRFRSRNKFPVKGGNQKIFNTVMIK